MNLAEKFLTVLKEFPQYRAVVKPGCIWNYEELDKAIRQVQKQLKSYNLVPQTAIALLIDDPLWLTASIWAVIRERLIYIVLDGTYPQERLAYILEDSQASLLIIDEEIRSGHQELIDSVPHHVINIEDSPLSPEIAYLQSCEKEDIVTLYYTSGSTGKPKGVIHNHATILHEVRIHTTTLQITPDDRFSAIYSLATIGSNRDFYAALLNGASWNFFPFRLYGMSALKDWIEAEKITILHAIPILFRELQKTSVQGKFDSVRVVFLAGDRVLPDDVLLFRENFTSGASFYTGIGASEATSIYTHWFVPREESLDYAFLPSGYPIPEKEVFLVNDDRERLSSDEEGEIAVCSYYLSPGYFGKEELTRKAFEKREDGSAVYFTGDQGRFDEQGRLVFIGRKDYQVKINGFRVELAEVEAVLKQHPQVEAAVVIATEEGTEVKKLVAYVVSLELIDNAQLREYLREKLPNYMIPGMFVFLDSLPLTPNGKVDRQALPSPEEVAISKDYIAPRTPGEEIIAQIFAFVLGMPSVGIHDNFFSLGGTSLQATQLISRLRSVFAREFTLRNIFEAPTIAELDDKLIRGGSLKEVLSLPPIFPVSLDDKVIPLSFAQERLWFLDQLGGLQGSYNIPVTLRLIGKLDLEVLEQSFNQLIDRHEVFRTSFENIQGRARQVIHPLLTLNLSVEELEDLEAQEREELLREEVVKEISTPFDIQISPLIRYKLWRLAADEYILAITMHHIIADGWSIGVLLRELSILYQASSQGQTSPLSPLPIQYADYAVWQRQHLQGEILETQLGYWISQLSGVPELLQLPTNRTRPSIQTYTGKTRTFILPSGLTEKLGKLSRESGTTLFMTLLAAFATLLYRYSGQEDIAIGSPVANRHHEEIESLIGFFANTLVYRINLEGEPSFLSLLHQVRETALEAYENQDVPFQRIVSALQPERSLTHSPLFQVMFVLQEGPQPQLELSGVTCDRFDAESTSAKFDLTVSMLTTSEGLTGRWEFNSDLFPEETIERMAGHFQNLLEAIITAPRMSVKELPLLTQQERDRLLSEWNDTATPYPQDKCIHQLFEDQVELTPNAIALVFENEQITYRELNCRANQLAHYLQKMGVKPEVVVGICLERSPLILVALLAILKAGGAYVPLDPNYPQERLAFMWEDIQAPVLLTQQHLVDSLPPCGTYIVSLDTDWEAIDRETDGNLEQEVTLDNLVYTIYTSGSTGKPKAIAMNHRCLSNLISWQLQNSSVPNGAKTLQFTSLNFDVSCQEIFSTWCSGGILVLVSEELRRDAVGFLHFLVNEEIERLFLPFVALQQLAEVADSQGLVPAFLREIITAGEPLQITPQIANLFQQLKGCTLHNQYGPAESHVVTAFTLKGSPQDWSALPPIGRPIANTQIYLLDSHQKPVPIGVTGELYIGGDGLARGYLNRPDLTTEKFIPNPFNNSKLYKTGDLARYLLDGNIEFLGRIDNQVKIRGFRVELGEIEATLSQHSAIEQGVVTARDDISGDKRLVAYLVLSQDQALTRAEIRRFLQQKLPNYMLPSLFVFLDTLPLTPNGKVDRRALPKPDQTRPELEETFVAPRNELEIQLTKIWGKVLEVEPISIKDNFFALGGHSLQAVRLVAAIEKKLKQQISLASIYKFSTIEKLAEIIIEPAHTNEYSKQLLERYFASSWKSLILVQAGASQLPMFIIHQGFKPSLIKYLDSSQTIYGLNYGMAQQDNKNLRLPKKIEDLASHYVEEIRALQPKGPYLLMGSSFGGLVAFEVAQQLIKAEQEIALLLLVDTSFYQKTTWIEKVTNLRSKNIKEIINKLIKKIDHKRLKYKQKNTLTLPDLLMNKRYYMAQKYQPKIYPYNITLLRVTEQLEKNSSNLGWRKFDKFAAQDVQILPIPGNHRTMFLEPNVQIMAKQIKASIDKVFEEL